MFATLPLCPEPATMLTQRPTPSKIVPPPKPIIIVKFADGLWTATLEKHSASARSNWITSPHLKTVSYDLGALDARKALCDAHPHLWAADFKIVR